MLNLEIEAKYRLSGGVDEAAVLAAKIAGLGGRESRCRHFEDNHMFDYTEGLLRLKGCGLRVRITDLGSTLTFKGPTRPDVRAKIREEIEVGVESGERLLAMLEKIGLRVFFRYQKYRTEYRLDSLTVVIDETPMGWFTELEGDAPDIEAAASRLGLNRERFVRMSYVGYFSAELARQGRGDEREVLFIDPGTPVDCVSRPEE